jgi:hypothetical protein
MRKKMGPGEGGGGAALEQRGPALRPAGDRWSPAGLGRPTVGRRPAVGGWLASAD